jgi:hypothetical protein
VLIRRQIRTGELAHLPLPPPTTGRTSGADSASLGRPGRLDPINLAPNLAPRATDAIGMTQRTTPDLRRVQIGTKTAAVIILPAMQDVKTADFKIMQVSDLRKREVFTFGSELRVRALLRGCRAAWDVAVPSTAPRPDSIHARVAAASTRVVPEPAGPTSTSPQASRRRPTGLCSAGPTAPPVSPTSAPRPAGMDRGLASILISCRSAASPDALDGIPGHLAGGGAGDDRAGEGL